MKRLFSICVVIASALCVDAFAQDATTVSGQQMTDVREAIVSNINYGLAPQIMNISGRQTASLDGQWKAIIDQYENGYYNYRLKPQPDNSSFFANKAYKDDKTKLIEYDFDTDGNLYVPGDWNTQNDRLYYYEGTIWYRQKFNVEPQAGKRYFLYFGAANYETIIGVNGHAVAKHTGGYTPFNIEVTDMIHAGENFVIVKVDNKRKPEGVPTVNSDWWNYGGITRSVCLVETPAAFVREYSLQLRKGTDNVIDGWVRMDGASAGEKVKVEVPEVALSAEVTVDADGYAGFSMILKKSKKKPGLVLWCPENPKLYDVNVSTSAETIADRIGFRTIEARGNELFLNGKKIFCRGVSVHEEQAFGANGRAYSEEHARVLLGWAKEMNCNFVRLAHYPHNEAMVRVAEEMGIMVWDEIPVYWTIHWDNPQTYENAQAQLVDMITRDRNRANVIIWSVANETPRSPERLAFLSKLIDKAHEMDATRLVSAAMEKEYLDKARTHATVNDELAEKADLMSFNQYVGWYDGSTEKCARVNWTFEIQKPVFISEWGGGALYGLHGDKTERFTEEYQEYLYQENVKMLERIPGLSGSTPWILKDFRSPRRQLKNIQDDYNRKGLVSERGERKKAFYVLQEWYGKLSHNF
ncbi:MAG: beta-glucuronidase [Bacteroidales bacterium]|nr:beta-glucuronidase [Bacteroidales bacterium]